MQGFRFEREWFSVNVLFKLIPCVMCTVGTGQVLHVIVVSGFTMFDLADVWRAIVMLVFAFAHAGALAQGLDFSGLMEKVGGKF